MKGGTINGNDRSNRRFANTYKKCKCGKHEIVEVPSSNIKKEIANILLQEGYIKNIEEYNDGVVPMLRLQ